MPAERFCNINRSVLTARAADAYREVVPVLRGVMRQPLFDEVRDVGNHFSDKRLSCEIVGNGLVHACEGPQFRQVVGVRQAPHVKDKV